MSFQDACIKTPERAQNVCTQLMQPTRADSQALEKIFPKAPNVNILKRPPPPAFDPTAECMAQEQKKKAVLPLYPNPSQLPLTFDEAVHESFAKGKTATRLHEAESYSEGQAVANDGK